MKWQRRARFSAVGALALAVNTATAQDTSSFAAVARAIASQPADAPRRPLERDAIARIYREPDVRALWSDASRGLTRQAVAVMDVLDNAAVFGLEPARYDVGTLRALGVRVGASTADAARFDVALSRAVVGLLTDLHAGRVDPQSVRFDLPNAHDRMDVAALAGGVARSASVAATIASVEPPYAGYRALEQALARYRRLAADTSLRLPRRTGRAIRPGDSYRDVPALAHVLVALGDLDPARLHTPSDSAGVPRYEGAVVDAVARFQRRHGLVADSAIGPATIAALTIPIARRVRQMELTLERWRWLPDAPPDRYLVVNIPAFRLYAFEHDSTACRPVLAMNVIVGQAEGRHDTPVFTSVMREVVFRPYWDVPLSIARKELIPQFRTRPESFAAEQFEIVRRNAPDVPTTTFAPTAANFARVRAGDLRLRQQPGSSNALGFVKFVFPNEYNVYLHGTPAQQLFAQTRRDFSHGCIRTERPTDLAELVLRDQPPWDRQAIDSVMNGEQTVHVPVVRPFTVYVLYATATVDDQGEVRFFPDVYRHDAALERLLGSSSAPPR